MAATIAGVAVDRLVSGESYFWISGRGIGPWSQAFEGGGTGFDSEANW